MSSKNQTIKVGISVGDVNGIGVELILKTLEDKNILEFFTPVIFGSTKLLNYEAKNLDKTGFNFNGIKTAEEARPKKINVVNLWNEPVTVESGVPTQEAGKLALESFQNATVALKNGAIDILVTAPFNKDTIQSDEYKHAGHTEYLGEVFNQEPLMILTAEDLSVALVTQHIPISQVGTEITTENLMKKARVFNETLKKDFYLTRPKIAVLGLNPHAGDNGLIGTEDEKIIKPAIEKMNEEGIMAFGPYASDSFFIPGKYESFDGVLAMYHDQGLIPFKMLHFNDGVNFTAGLDKIRTSPDHGVAYDIAGKGIADETSFKEAIFKGIELYKARNQDAIDHSNPLPERPKEEKKRAKKEV